MQAKDLAWRRQIAEKSGKRNRNSRNQYGLAVHRETGPDPLEIDKNQVQIYLRKSVRVAG